MTDAEVREVQCAAVLQGWRAVELLCDELLRTREALKRAVTDADAGRWRDDHELVDAWIEDARAVLPPEEPHG